MVLLAMVDANCKFIAVYVDSYGKQGDSGIFNKSNMGKLIYSGKLLPPDKELNGFEKEMPYIIIGDEAFRLLKYIMKYYTKSTARNNKAKQILYCRLCRARLTHFLFSHCIKPETCDSLVLAAYALNNLLRSGYLSIEEQQCEYCVLLDELAPSGLLQMRAPRGHPSGEGFEIGEAQYFCNDGAVSWQERYINKV